VESPLDAPITSASKRLLAKKFARNAKGLDISPQKSTRGGKLLVFDATFGL
jgi:hypothetical protein